MKIKNLIGELQQLDPELEIVLSKDAEGNGFSPLEEVGEGYYFFEDEGELLNEDDMESEGYEKSDGVKVICFWPTN